MKKFRIFCIPYAGGSEGVYTFWNKYFDDRFEVCPITLAGHGSRYMEKFYEDIDQAVDDILDKYREFFDDGPYVLFGHSMGADLAYELAYKIKENKVRYPAHIFFSGRCHHDLQEKYDVSSMLDIDFLNEVNKLGGIDSKLFENEELRAILVPILRADFKMLEKSRYREKKELLDCDITALGGKDDAGADFDKLQRWTRYTKGSCDVWIFEGGHFFINDYVQEITEKIAKKIAGENQYIMEPLELSERIEDFCNDFIRNGIIPGGAVSVIYRDKCLIERGFGFADIEKKVLMNENTYFQLGSMSKAFTGMAILYLDSLGLIDMDDNVNCYIPWFYVKYKDEKHELTIRNLVNHTSGIPFASIMSIPEGAGEWALKETVQTVVGRKLMFRPGERFSYATINYDILGYIIEIVSNMKFEDYMKNMILEPLGLNEIVFELQKNDEMATGYKYEFIRNRYFKEPVYKGNTPAGYFLANAKGMTKWLRIQLIQNCSDNFKQIIKRSRNIYEAVKINGDYYYGAGWRIDKDDRSISHNGHNPNYVSHIYVNPDEGNAVAVMLNTSSLESAQHLCEGIHSILSGKKAKSKKYGKNMVVDWICSCGAGISALLLIILFVALCNKNLWYCAIVSSMVCLPTTLLLLCKKTRKLPKRIDDFLRFAQVWTPASVSAFMVLIFILLIYIVSYAVF